MLRAHQRLRQIRSVLQLPDTPEELLREIVGEYVYHSVQAGGFPSQDDFEKLMKMAQEQIQEIAKKIATLNKHYRKFV